MIIKNLGTLIFYSILVAVLFTGYASLREEPVLAATCCAIGSDCPGRNDICCDNVQMGALPCQYGMPGYCRLNCNP